MPRAADGTYTLPNPPVTTQTLITSAWMNSTLTDIRDNLSAWAGNFNITGSGRRITGNLSDANQANRLGFQSNVVNGATSVVTMPNGSGNGSNLLACAGPDPSNSPYAQFVCNTAGAQIAVGATGSATAPNYSLTVGAAVRYTCDTAGTHTFSGPVNFSGNIAASGAGTFNGIVNSGGACEFGSSTVASTPFIDFHSSGNAVDYDSRIIASGGTAAAGNGTLDFYGSVINAHASGGYANLYGSSTYASLRMIAGSYMPFMRASSGNSSIEWVNSANSAVNLTLSDAGVLTSRGIVNCPGLTSTGTINALSNIAVQNSQEIDLYGQSNTYTARLRGDSAGLCGFINQAGNAWTLQIKDAGYVKAMNGFIWGDESNIGGQYNGTGSIGGHTEAGALVVNSNGVNMHFGHPGAGGTQAQFWVAGASVGSITSSTTNTSYNTTSDYRLKKNVKDLDGGLDRVMRLRPVDFDWISNGEASRGFIAHELALIEPLAVTGEKDAMMEDREAPDGPQVPDYQQVDTSYLIPDLVAAVQELKGQLEVALQRIAELEAP
jgi:Chaperone of endosialidase